MTLRAGKACPSRRPVDAACSVSPLLALPPAAAVAAIQHRFPAAGPLSPPLEGPAAGGAGLRGLGAAAPAAGGRFRGGLSATRH